MNPTPGHACPTCGLIVPKIGTLRTGAHHPDNAHEAGRDANRRLPTRAHKVLAYLRECGPHGATDDDVDAHFGWGHQSTTPVMCALRNARMIGWTADPLNPAKWYRRATRTKRGVGNVNVLAEFVRQPEEPER